MFHYFVTTYTSGRLLNVCVVFLLFSSSVVSAIDRPVFEYDERKWELGYQASHNGAQIEEYVLSGETVEDWSELVTWQYLPNFQERADALTFMKQLRKLRQARDPEVVWEVIEKDHQSVLYKWESFNNPTTGDYLELARIVEDTDGMHIFHYTAKYQKTFQNNIAHWTASFMAINVYE